MLSVTCCMYAQPQRCICCSLLPAQVVRIVLSGVRLCRPARCPRNVHQLMTDCWAEEPCNRPSFKDILSAFRCEAGTRVCMRVCVLRVARTKATALPRLLCNG